MLDKGWQRAFDDPIPIPGGRHLITLHAAATYATRLPKNAAESEKLAAAIERCRRLCMRAKSPESKS